MQSNTLHWLSSRLAAAEKARVPMMVAAGTSSILGLSFFSSCCRPRLLPMPMPTCSIRA